MRIIRTRQNDIPPFAMDWRGVGMQRVWRVYAPGDDVYAPGDELDSRDGLTRSESLAWHDRLARSNWWGAVTGSLPCSADFL